jgi:L-ascorbate metabolism protein UlaG (beta-lactamase superfamily)
MSRSFVLLGSFVLLLSSLLTPHPSQATGQEPKQEEPKKEPEAKRPKDAVTIRWYGQSFFQVETALGHKFAIDPHGIPAFGRQFVPADFVLVSHSHDDHSLIEMIDTGKKDARIPENDVYRGVAVVKGKQEWKTIDEKRGPIRLRTIATYHDAMNGLQRGKNSIWVVESDGLVFCHLGDLGHELTDEQVKAIGKVDVLFVPVGGIYTINGEQAQDVMKKLKPRLYVLPMHYGVPGYDELAGPEEFLDGLKNVKKMPTTNELTFKIDEKPETPSVVLLGWKKAEEPPPPPKKP